MHMLRMILVTAVVLALVDPTEAWRGRRLKRKIKRIGRKIGKVLKPLKKVGCKVLFGVGCPAAVGAVGATLAGGTGGLGTAAAVIGATAGKNACHARKKRCKRSVTSGEILLPFSDRFTDYDQNNDKLISYEEFAFAIMKSLPMANPEELREPFIFADLNDDDHLDNKEFHGAPFMFGHEIYSWRNADKPLLNNNSSLDLMDSINITASNKTSSHKLIF